MSGNQVLASGWTGISDNEYLAELLNHTVWQSVSQSPPICPYPLPPNRALLSLASVQAVYVLPDSETVRSTYHLANSDLTAICRESRQDERTCDEAAVAETVRQTEGQAIKQGTPAPPDVHPITRVTC